MYCSRYSFFFQKEYPYLFPFTLINMKVTIMDKNSPRTILVQIPSTSINRGKTKTRTIWNPKVLKKDIEADKKPLLSAVNRALPNIENPAKR